MSHVMPTQVPRRLPGDGFARKTWAVLMKEFIQLKRDRLSFAMIIMIPLLQLVLFGYAINTNPRHLPTAVLLQENSDVGRAILAALKNTDYFRVIAQPRSEADMDELMAAGKVLFGVEIPANFERGVRRGDKPAMLIIADATDPVASGSALGAL
jgi:ABC-2 type transport system permease protein